MCRRFDDTCTYATMGIASPRIPYAEAGKRFAGIGRLTSVPAPNRAWHQYRDNFGEGLFIQRVASSCSTIPVNTFCGSWDSLIED